VTEKGKTVGEVGLTFGSIFLLIAFAGGGGFTAKELTIPKVPAWARVASGIVGACLLAGGVLFLILPEQLHDGPIGPSGQPCRSPHDVPTVAGGDRSEVEVRQLLQTLGLFNVSVSDDVTHPGFPAGVVIRQTPAPGTRICPRDPVTITVAK
jgi:PASTA domain